MDLQFTMKNKTEEIPEDAKENIEILMVEGHH